MHGIPNMGYNSKTTLLIGDALRTQNPFFFLRLGGPNTSAAGTAFPLCSQTCYDMDSVFLGGSVSPGAQ